MDFNLTDTLNLSQESFRFFREILIVLGIGLIIGLEREYSKAKDLEEDEKEHFAGVRTFPLVAIIGYLAIYLGNQISMWIYPVSLAAVAGFAVVTFSIGLINLRYN